MVRHRISSLKSQCFDPFNTGLHMLAEAFERRTPTPRRILVTRKLLCSRLCFGLWIISPMFSSSTPTFTSVAIYVVSKLAKVNHISLVALLGETRATKVPMPEATPDRAARRNSTGGSMANWRKRIGQSH
jgi:hypothetical protein